MVKEGGFLDNSQVRIDIESWTGWGRRTADRELADGVATMNQAAGRRFAGYSNGFRCQITPTLGARAGSQGRR
jgi:hypothetical protein